MKYMLLIYSREDCMTNPEREACMVESLKVCADLAARGRFLDAAPLHPVSTAATVRVRQGQTLVTDGPFAETTEQLGGYYVVDLPDLDEAIGVACRLPPVHKGTVEIRPVLELDGLPPPQPARSGDPAGEPHLLLCYHAESHWAETGPDSRAAAMAEAAGRCRELHAAGHYLSSAPLHPAATATSVRVRDGKRVVTDGPFAETHEVLGGYYLVLARSREEAVRMAERQPGARAGGIEVRPVFDLSPLRTRG